MACKIGLCRATEHNEHQPEHVEGREKSQRFPLTKALPNVNYRLRLGKVAERVIQKLQLVSGRVPFDEWYHSLIDKRMRAAVDVRLARVRLGNFGNHRSVGQGVFELKIDLGPGLRVYYGEYEGTMVLLLGGGDKSTQQRDINAATKLWRQWKEFKT